MRITVLLLFTVMLQVIAAEAAYSQSAKLSVKANQMSLTDLFAQIEKQSEFLFFYVDKEVNNINVNVKASNKPIEEILSSALKGTGLTYVINDRNINIIKRSNIQQQQQQSKKRITGELLSIKPVCLSSELML